MEYLICVSNMMIDMKNAVYGSIRIKINKRGEGGISARS